MSESIVTPGQITRLKKDWEVVTKEPIEVQFIKGTFYAYGSELATLRLFKKYSGNFKGNEKVAQGYSENLKTFYFELETNL